MFRAKGVQRQHIQPPDQSWKPGFFIGVYHQLLLICRVHLVQLDQDGAARLAEWSMAGASGVAQVGAGWVVALFI